MQNSLILLSSNAEDRRFAVSVSQALGIKVEAVSKKERLHEILHSAQGCFILMNFDPVIEKAGPDYAAVQDLIAHIEKLRAWHRVFAISKYELRDVVAQGPFNLFSKYFYRSFTPENIQV